MMRSDQTLKDDSSGDSTVGPRTTRPAARLALSFAGLMFALGAAALALYARYLLYPFQTGDYYWYTGPWYSYIQSHGGFAALRDDFSEYTPSYLNLLATASLLTPAVEPIVAIKLVSSSFDLLCAWLLFLIVKRKYGGGPLPTLAGLAVLFAPTVILNSAAWGQADSIYTAGLLACLYLTMTRRHVAAIAAFGLSFATKQQALFLAPFLLTLVLMGRIRWRLLLTIPAAYLLTLVPSLLAGHDLLGLLVIYLKQAGRYEELTMNAPSLYQWIPAEAYSIAYPVGLVASSAVMVTLAVLVWRRRPRLSDDLLLALATASVLIVPFLTPKMHDRYFFPADVLTIAFAFYFPRLFAVPIAVGLASLLSYGPFLIGVQALPGWYLPLVILATMVVVCWQVRLLMPRTHVGPSQPASVALLSRAIPSILLLLLIGVPLAYQIPLARSSLIPPPHATAAQLAAISYSVDVTFGDVQVVGYGPGRPRVGADGRLTLDLFWKKRGTIVDTRSLTVRLLDGAGNLIVESAGTRPLLWWTLEDTVVETRAFDLDVASLSSTGVIALSASGPAGLPVEGRDRNGTAIGETVGLGRFRYGQAASAPAAAADRPDATRFGSWLALVGHEIDSVEVRNGEVVRGTLEWLALDRTDDDYTVFVQIIGPGGLVAQIDTQPRSGSYPTSWWDSDELVADTFEIPIDGLAPGEYTLIAGLYELESGQRLLTASGDFVELGRVTVVE